MSEEKALLFEGLRILYLEDEAITAMNFVAMLENAGASVEDCSTVDAAQQALQERSYDVALLDLEVHGHMSSPVARAASDRGVAVVLVTGYEPNTLPPDLQQHTVCQKPCSENDLLSAIRKAISNTGVDA